MLNFRKGYSLAVLTASIALLGASAASAQSSAGGSFALGLWQDGFNASSISGFVDVTMMYDDGDGASLYVGGQMSAAGNAAALNIAEWNGSSWEALGQGVNDRVLAMAGFAGRLYAGGEFTTAGGAGANYVAAWDGAAWTPLSTGMNGEVFALATYDDGGGEALYAAGEFTTAGGVGTNYIAKWDGTNWSAVGGGLNDVARSLLVHDDGGGPALFIGGDVLDVDGGSATGLVKWDGTTWTELGFDWGVSALAAVDEGEGAVLYAVEGDWVPSHRIARWDGTTMSRVATFDYLDFVTDIVSFDDGGGPALYASGALLIDGIDYGNLAKWNGSSWSSVEVGELDGVRAFGVADFGEGDRLLAADRNSIRQLDAGEWSRLSVYGAGLTGGAAGAFATFDDGAGPALFVGGSFSVAGLSETQGIAAWNGSAWRDLAGGLSSGSVSALAVYDDGSGPALYAGGNFDDIGGSGVSDLAKWDGTNWTAVGGGVDDWVASLATYDDGSGPALYASGAFTTAGGVPALRIAKWDGASWSPLGTGLDSSPSLTLKVFDDGTGEALYAGGAFTVGGGIQKVARWDGSAWSAVGTMPLHTVYALEAYDDGTGPALYAAGRENSSPHDLYRWDGGGWSPVGADFGGDVRTMHVYNDGLGDALFIGGEFQTAGGGTARRIVKWDGTTWSNLEFGIGNVSGGSVNVLGVYDDGTGPALFAGGSFATASGKVSANLAQFSRTKIFQSPFESGDLSGWTSSSP